MRATGSSNHRGSRNAKKLQLGDLQVIKGWTMVGSSKVSASSMLLWLCDVTNDVFSLQPPFLSMYERKEDFNRFVSTFVSRIVWVDTDESSLCKYFNCWKA